MNSIDKQLEKFCASAYTRDLGWSVHKNVASV